MELIFIIALVFFLAFFIESIFGFGGLILSFTVLSFFMNTKDMIFLGIYVAMIASLVVILTDYKSFSKKMFLFMLPLGLIGTITGVALFAFLSDLLLLKFFAAFLFLYAISSLFNKSITLPFLQQGFVFLGGILQGVFGTGGPFTLMGVKEKFKNKSELRTTMASFFLFFNFIRIGQLTLQGVMDFTLIFSYWWLVFVIIAAILIGYRIHVRFNEHYFRLGITLLVLFASIVLLFK